MFLQTVLGFIYLFDMDFAKKENMLSLTVLTCLTLELARQTPIIFGGMNTLQTSKWKQLDEHTGFDK